MSEMDDVAQRLEGRVGRRFVEVLREFVAAEVARLVTSAREIAALGGTRSVPRHLEVP